MEEQYRDYIKKNLPIIKFKIEELESDVNYNFNSFFDSNSLASKPYIPIYIGIMIIAFLAALMHQGVIAAALFVFLAALPIWIIIISSKCKETISNYIFYKYKRDKIIEAHIRQSEQQEIQKLLNEMFDVKSSAFSAIANADPSAYMEIYEIKLRETKLFYSYCLSKIKEEL